jgi:hypothetical protein
MKKDFFFSFSREIDPKKKKKKNQNGISIFVFSLNIIHPQIPLFPFILNGNRSKYTD